MTVRVFQVRFLDANKPFTEFLVTYVMSLRYIWQQVPGSWALTETTRLSLCSLSQVHSVLACLQALLHEEFIVIAVYACVVNPFGGNRQNHCKPFVT